MYVCMYTHIYIIVRIIGCHTAHLRPQCVLSPTAYPAPPRSRVHRVPSPTRPHCVPAAACCINGSGGHPSPQAPRTAPGPQGGLGGIPPITLSPLVSV